jgi:hypothetical protein
VDPPRQQLSVTTRLATKHLAPVISKPCPCSKIIGNRLTLCFFLENNVSLPSAFTGGAIMSRRSPLVCDVKGIKGIGTRLENLFRSGLEDECSIYS